MGNRNDRSIWYDVAWPILTGLVAAAGVIVTYTGIGLLGTVAIFGLMELTVAPTAWSLMVDVGRSGRPAVLELAPACALATVAVWGLVDGLGGWSIPLLLLVAATSPLLQRRRRQRLARRYGSDRAQIRREFDAIVAHAFGSEHTEG